MSKTAKTQTDPWCSRCVYRGGIPGRCGPCTREGLQQRYCLVRILIAELYLPQGR